jgi:hypothetical protein
VFDFWQDLGTFLVFVFGGMWPIRGTNNRNTLGPAPRLVSPPGARGDPGVQGSGLRVQLRWLAPRQRLAPAEGGDGGIRRRGLRF